MLTAGIVRWCWNSCGDVLKSPHAFWEDVGRLDRSRCRYVGCDLPDSLSIGLPVGSPVD